MVSSTDVQQTVDEIADRIGPDWREAKWPVPQMIEALNDAAFALRTFEQAALKREPLTLAEKMEANRRDRAAVIDLMAQMPGIRAKGL